MFNIRICIDNLSNDDKIIMKTRKSIEMCEKIYGHNYLINLIYKMYKREETRCKSH